MADDFVDLALDSAWQLEKGADTQDLTLVEGPAQLRQELGILAKTIRGEYDFDIENGMPVFEMFTDFGGDLELVAAATAAVFAQYPRVLSVERCDVESSDNDRGFTAAVALRTEYGMMELTV